MRGLMMDYQLSIPAIVRRAETLFRHKTVTSRRPDRTVVRHSFADDPRPGRGASPSRCRRSASSPAIASRRWPGPATSISRRISRFPSIGAVLHTLNLRLHHDELAYIVNDAEDRVLIVDESLLPLFEKFREQVNVEHVIVVRCRGSGVDAVRRPGSACRQRAYRRLRAAPGRGRPGRASWSPRIDERDAAAMCYTSGTTGRPKGVLYSHRAIVLHSLAQGLRDALSLGEDDTVLPIVPMFHVNAWGLPFTCTLLGCNQVFPGPHLDPQSVLSLLVSERVTLTGGVPTVWLGVLQELDRNPGKYDLSALRAIVVGGSAAPLSLIRAYQERHDLQHSCTPGA